MSICPKCGTKNRPEALFCRRCQKPLSPPAGVTCASCGAVQRQGGRFCKRCGQPLDGPAPAPSTKAGGTCPRCGTPIRDGARFCPRCRTPLSTAPTGRPPGLRCPQCGAHLRPGARFCANCSRPLTHQPTHSTPPPPRQFATGDLLPLTLLADRYVILEQIAQGGMGAIYKAQDKRLKDKIVAVKEMSESAVNQAERLRVLESFRREAALLARLEHPNLVRVSDRFQAQGRQYMVMEFIEGQTLQIMLKDRTQPFSEPQVLRWADQLCKVLAYLHGQTPPIIYRDVKPANVMVLDGSDQIKLIDFGIVRFFKSGKHKDTIEFGTDGYAPPEQYGKSQTDERSDVYALGAMLHQLLTLREPLDKPFHFPPVRSLNRTVSPHVAAAIEKAVQTNRSKRHPSMDEMRTALLVEGSPAEWRPTPPRPAAPKPAPKGPPTPTPPPRQVPLVVPAAVSFGDVVVGSKVSPHYLSLALPAGDRATLKTGARWLRISPRKTRRERSRVTLTLRTRRLKLNGQRLRGNPLKVWAGLHAQIFVPARRESRANVEIILGSTGKKQLIPVTVTAVPRDGQIRFGWMIAMTAMALEVFTVIGMGVTLIILL